MKKNYRMVLCLLFFAKYLAAGNTEATAQFLLLPPNSYSLALGEAVTSVASGGSEFTNPALLVEKKEVQMEISYMRWLEDVTHTTLGFIYPLADKDRAIGMGISYLSSGDMGAYDEEGTLTGSVSMANWSAGFSFAQRIAYPLSFGVGVRTLSLDLAGDKGTGIALNAGLMLKPFKTLTIAAVRRNMGPDMRVGDVLNPLPEVTRTGISYQSRELLLTADYDADEGLGFGIDYRITETLSVRGGYKNLDDLREGAGLSLGLGFNDMGSRMEQILSYFNYAMTSYGELGFVHSFSLGIKF